MPKKWFEPTPPPDLEAPQPPLFQRVGWFAAIAVTSGLAVMLAAYALRGLLFLD